MWAPPGSRDGRFVLVGGSSQSRRPSIRNGSKGTDTRDLEHLGSILRSHAHRPALTYRFPLRLVLPRDSDDVGDTGLPHQAFPEPLSSSFYLGLLMPNGTRWQDHPAQQDGQQHHIQLHAENCSGSSREVLGKVSPT